MKKQIQRGGLKVEKRLKRKHYIFEKAFPTEEKVLGGSPVELRPLGRLERIVNAELFVPPTYQGNENACVVASAIEANRYFSYFNSGRKVNMDWKYVFDRVPQYEGGTKVSEVCDFLYNNGVPQVGLTGQDATNNAYKHRIKGYFHLYNKSPENLYRALVKAPVMLGLDTRKAGLTKESGYAHEVLAIDVKKREDKWKLVIVNHWNENEQLIQEIPMETPLYNAVVITDLPDDVDKQDMRLGCIDFLKQLF